MAHAATCTGCPLCNTTLRAQLLDDARAYLARHAHEDTTMRHNTTNLDDFAPIDGITPAILRAAEQAPTPDEQRAKFEERLRNMRLRGLQLEAEAEARHAEATPAPRLLTAAELDDFTPPDPYTAGIRALQAMKGGGR